VHHINIAYEIVCDIVYNIVYDVIYDVIYDVAVENKILPAALAAGEMCRVNCPNKKANMINSTFNPYHNHSHSIYHTQDSN
jgi:hypothetical protein